MSEMKKAPEIADEVVCSSTQPADTAFPKISFACNALLLDGGSDIETGLMTPAPCCRAPE